MVTRYSLNMWSASPTLFKNALSKIPPEKLHIPTGLDRFTPHEVMCHMADFESIFLGRIESIIAENGATLEPKDPDEQARLNNYAALELESQIKLFAERRMKTIEFLQGLQPEDWQAYGIHSINGKTTTWEIVELMLSHDLYHAEQIVSVI